MESSEAGPAVRICTLEQKTQRHCEETKEGQRIFKLKLHILFKTLLITYERNLLNKKMNLLAPMTKLEQEQGKQKIRDTLTFKTPKGITLYVCFHISQCSVLNV